MSLQQSNLAAQGLGYDMIFAMSQNGLTETMGDKYDNLPGKEVTVYWGWNNSPKGFPPIDYSLADLKLPAGLDPFTVPAWQTSNGANTKISQLQTAKFAMAAKGTPGIPDSVSFPEILTLNSDGTADLTIYFLDVKVVAAIYDDAGNITQYLNVAQDDDTPLTIVFRLPFTTISRNDNLPAAVQQALGNPNISVQQLVLNIGAGGYHTGMNIPGLTPILIPALNNQFGYQCLSALADAGLTAVGYSANTEQLLPATLAITSMAGRGDMLVDASGKIISNPSIEQLGINTLNLYCATNGDPLPAPAQLPWNWLDTSQDGKSYDGAIAFKYGTILNYFKSKMDPYVAGNCYLPAIPLDEDGIYFYPTLNGGQAPTVASVYSVAAPKGNPYYGMMLDYGYQSPWITNTLGDMSMTLESEFYLKVYYSDETVTVRQQLMVQGSVDFGAGPMNIEFVNRVVTDVYAVKVDLKGYLLLDPTTTSQDYSNYSAVDPSLIPDYFQGVIGDLSDYVNGIASGSFDIDPLNQLQQFVFPGGRTFQFSDAIFSDYGDLVAHIKFADNAQ